MYMYKERGFQRTIDSIRMIGCLYVLRVKDLLLAEVVCVCVCVCVYVFLKERKNGQVCVYKNKFILSRSGDWTDGIKPEIKKKTVQVPLVIRFLII